MKRVVIADTSCLIVLSKLTRLPLLQELFNEVIITDVVAAEFGEPLPNWLKQVSVTDTKLLHLLSTSLDIGEASSIALAIEQQDDVLLIIDEKKGRQVATTMGLPIIGTIGLLLKAKQKGLVTDMIQVIEKLNATNFRLSPSLISHLLS